MTEPIHIGGLRNVKDELLDVELQQRQKAIERAQKSGVSAYPVYGLVGFFVVPSGEHMGMVYEVQLYTSGQPRSCTCEARVKWCKHAALAHLWWMDFHEQLDFDAKSYAASEIRAMQEKAKEQ